MNDDDYSEIVEVWETTDTIEDYIKEQYRRLPIRTKVLCHIQNKAVLYIGIAWILGMLVGSHYPIQFF